MKRVLVGTDLREDLGLDDGRDLLIAHLAKVNGIAYEEAQHHVDDTLALCAEKGVRASVDAVVEALGQVAAVHHAAAEIRAEKAAAAAKAKPHRGKWKYPKKRR